MKRFMIVMLVLMLALTACNDNPNGGLIITNPAKQPFTASEVVAALSMEKVIADVTSEDAEEKGISVEYKRINGDETQGRGIVPQSDNVGVEIEPGSNVIVATVEFNGYVCNGVTIDGQMNITFGVKDSDDDNTSVISSYTASASDLTLKAGRKQSTVAIDGFSGTIDSEASVIIRPDDVGIEPITSDKVKVSANGFITIGNETVSKAEASGSDNLKELIENAVDGKLSLAAKVYKLNEAITVDDTLTINGVEGTTIKAKATITVSATGNLTINNVDIDGSQITDRNTRLISVYGTLNMSGCDLKAMPAEEATARTAIGVALETDSSKASFKDCYFSDMVCGICSSLSSNYSIVDCSGEGKVKDSENGKVWVGVYTDGISEITGFDGLVELYAGANGSFDSDAMDKVKTANPNAIVESVND